MYPEANYNESVFKGGCVDFQKPCIALQLNQGGCYEK